MILISISGIISLLYIIINIIISKKIPESISAMVYNLSKDKLWIWTIYIWIIACTVGLYMVEALNETVEGLGFATMGSLSFCGAMPLIKNDKNTLHNIFGVGAGILSLICVALINPMWLLVWIVMIVFIIPKLNKILSKYLVFISECLCAASMYGSLIH